LIVGKLVRKNIPTQVTGFIIDLAGKCIEGLQMNWVSYFINQLEKDFREAQDQGYKFHFNWLLILFTFIAWEMPEGATFLENTLHRFGPFVKFRTDRHFIYITARADEHKEELQSYYKLTKEDMEEINKEWPVEFLIPVDQVELSDPNLIDSPMVTREEYDAPISSRRKKKEEVQELNNASKETSLDLPRGGGGDKVDKEEDKGEEDKQKQGEVTPPRDPLEEADTSKKINVPPMKPTSRKKSKASKPQMQTMLTMDDIDLIIFAISDTSEDILQCNEA
jgi:hypothetical protein